MERLTEWRNGHGAIVNNRENYIDKLARYEDAEEQGRLIVLPCQVGDTVYWIPGFFNGSPILSARVAGFTYYSKNELRLELPDFDIEPIYPNAHLFLTREDAEKALEGMK